MSNTNTAPEAIKVHVLPENIEVKLFVNAQGRHAVRLYDLDAGEMITVVSFPSPAGAEDYFAKAINPSGSIVVTL
jgi:uncharacterized protein YqjF (DUF2071 family)